MRITLYFLSPAVLLAFAYSASLAGSLDLDRRQDRTPAERQERRAMLEHLATVLRHDIARDQRRLAQLQAVPSTSRRVEQEISRLMRDIPADQARLRSIQGRLATSRGATPQGTMRTTPHMQRTPHMQGRPQTVPFHMPVMRGGGGRRR